MAPAATQTSTAAQSKTSPKQNNKTPTKSESSAADTKTDSNKTTSAKPDSSANATAAKPLAPPPKPGQNDTPDYFAGQSGGSLSLEPNPFEQSFGGGSGPETPGGTKLPSLASLTSPSSLLPGNNTTPFNWGGGSLRTGPLSPAMLSGPQNDYFSENHGLRGSYPTPNESGLRSGLTPGGSGSMFPAQSPNSQALFSQLASGGATPSTLDFHRTAMSAASKQANGTQANQQTQQQAQQAQQQTQPQQPQQQQQQAVTSQPQEMPAGATVKTEAKASGPFDPHDNDAANGLFMLAQGRNQGAGQFAGNANKAGGKANNAEADNGSEENDAAKPNTRGKGKKGQATNARRKAEEPPAAKAPPNKKAKAAPAAASPSDGEASDDDDEKLDEAGNKIKMTDEEKRKNFLERNRVAALKCRQRKKQWLANLQTKVEMFSSENDALTAQITQLREEVVNLKTLLLAHKDCPVTQQQGLHGAFMSQVVEPFNPQMNPYGMAPGMPQQQQQVMAGQPMQRRFS